MFVCSDQAADWCHCHREWQRNSQGDMAASGGCPSLPSRHQKPRRAYQSAKLPQCDRHQVGRSRHSPVFHLPDIGVLIQQFLDPKWTHRIHLHHQQWVGKDKQISLTWGLESRSAILPFRSAEFDPWQTAIKASNVPTNYQYVTVMLIYNKN